MTKRTNCPGCDAEGQFLYAQKWNSNFNMKWWKMDERVKPGRKIRNIMVLKTKNVRNSRFFIVFF
jgi:hypothetical protein